MDRECDVLVVGAGPAGSVTAWYAAKNGANVLMIEKRQEIGSPVRCGEGTAKGWWDSVGITRGRWVVHEVQGARIISPNGTVFSIREGQAGSEVGAVIERDLFDKYLAQEAARAGAEIMLKTAATGVLKEGTYVKGVSAKRMGENFRIQAKIVVGADGFESQVGRWAGLDTSCKPNDITTCLQYRMTNIDVDDEFCDFYLGTCYAPGGYVWVFPKDEVTANVGIGILLSKVRQKGDVKRYLDSFIEKHPGLAKGTALDVVAGAVSVCAPLEKTVADGLMLVGDAARMIDPLTGGGIANSCQAGKIAGIVAAEAIQAGDCSAEFLQRYENGWRELLENKLYRNWMAKEKLITLDDATLDKIIATLASVDIGKLSVYNILKALQEKYPELVKEFEQLL